MTMQRRSIEVRFALDETAPGSLKGFASVYGVLDSHGSVFMPWVFAASLAEHRAAGTRPMMLWRHAPSLEIGHWLEIREEPAALFVDGQLDLTRSYARRAHGMLKTGELDGLSVGFRARRETTLADGTRAILEAELIEISLVPRPSNPKARVTEVRTAANPAGLAASLRRAAALIGGSKDV